MTPSHSHAVYPAAGAALIAVLTLIAWWFRPSSLFLLGPHHIPMAPSTALLVLLGSLALCLRAMPMQSRLRRALETSAAFLILAAALPLGIDTFHAVTVPIEAWLAQTSDTSNGIPLGRMAPLTAACLVLFSLALLAGQIQSARWSMLQSVKACLSLAVLLIGLTIAGAYLIGMPFMYDGATIPVAFLSAVSFILLGASLLLTTGWEAWPLRIFIRSSTLHSPAFPFKITWSLLLFSLMFALGTVAVGLQYLQRTQIRAKQLASDQLSAVADLKARLLLQWRDERMADAHYFSQSLAVARDVAQLLRTPHDPATLNEVLHWLTLLKANQRYYQATLYDPELQPLAAVTSTDAAALLPAEESVRDAFASSQVQLSDVHQHPAVPFLHFHLLVPIFTPEFLIPAPPPHAPPRAAVALIDLIIHPDQFLQPLIQSWPLTSPSAETLLVHRQNQQILISSKSRIDNPTGGLTSEGRVNPWIEPPAPGVGGVLHGIDYQGAHVIAVLYDIPDTPWQVITKVDQEDLYAPLRRQARTAAAIACALLITMTLGLTIISRRHHERVLRNQLLIESERRAVAEQYEHLMKYANDAVFLLDARLHILEANHRATQIYGWTLPELQNLTFGELQPPDEPTPPRSDCDLLTLGPHVFEAIHRRKDQTAVPVEVSTNSIELRGAPCIFAIIRDITERKKAEHALRQQVELQHQLAQIANTVPGAIYSFLLRPDGSMCFPYASPSLETIFGMSADQVRLDASSALAMIHPDDLKGVFDTISDSARDLTPWRNEFRVRTPAGVDLWIEGRSVPHRRPDGSTLWHGFMQDISDRKRAEEQLRQLSRAVEQSPVSVIITNGSGDIAYVNPKFTQVTGYSLDEVLGKNPRILKGGDTPVEFYRDLWQTVTRGGMWQGELHNRRKDGTLFWEQVSISPILDDEGRITHYLGIKEDITERKKLEQERAAMKAQLLQQQRLESVGTLAGGVAHEINNPINGIMNYAQLIQDRLDPGHPLSEYTTEILNETHRIATIVRNLLTFSRTDRQSHSPARMSDIVNATLSLIRTIIRQDQITLTIDVPTDLPMLPCRTQQIQQVLMNLMTNARDALNERFPNHDPDKVMMLRANLVQRDGQPHIRVTVEDHGCGIPPAIRSRLFDPFFTTKPRDKGTGLGLSISHGIVMEHYGSLTVESEPGRFTRFHMDLPVQPPQPQSPND